VWGAVEELKAQGRLEVVSIKNRLRGGATSTGYRDINMSVKFRGHVCEIQIQLAAILEVKHDGHKAYELVRSLELEDELEASTTLADLAGSCSPATRVALGVLRFFVAVMASVISADYIVFGVLYDSGESTRYLGAMVFGAVDTPGLLFSAFQASPFALVAVVALRDLLRQVATTYAAAPCRKRTIQAVVAALLWLLTAVVTVPFLTNPVIKDVSRLALLGVIVVWTPGVVAYAWATAPSTAAADRPIERSRVALLYDKYFGLNGRHFGAKVQASQLLL